jgi:hypothetical protein
MVELIAGVIFLGSTAGMITIAVRRMPSAEQVSERAGDFKLADMWIGIRNWLETRIKKIPCFKEFSWMEFLQKRLLKIRVLALKTENKINEYMTKLRQRAEEQKKREEALLDDYWKDIKTIVKSRRPVRGAKRSVESEPGTAQESAAAVISGTNVGPETAGQTMSERAPSGAVRQKIRQSKKKKKFRDPFQW